MGYTTDFSGTFKLNKPLKKVHKDYLVQFSYHRHIRWNPRAVKNLPDPVREAAGLPLGRGAAYFLGSVDAEGEEIYLDSAVEDGLAIDDSRPPVGVPDNWCQWIPNRPGTAIKWDGNEKFYSYDKWIKYLIKHFLAPWGYKLNGTVKWQGESEEDVGEIVVKNNQVTLIGKPGRGAR